VLRERNQLDDNLREDPKRALGAAHQSDEVVPRDGFQRACPRTEKLARRRDTFERHKVVFGHAVLDRAQAARILRHVAAEGGDRHAPRVGRIHQADSFRGCVQVCGDDPRLHGGKQVLAVDLKDPLHPAEVNDYAALRGD